MAETTPVSAGTPSDARDLPVGPDVAGVPGDPLVVDNALAVLGMLAYSELAAFSRLAADATLAPTLAQRLELSRMAGVALARLDRVQGRVTELGGELEGAMEPFAGVLTDFDARTPPSTWGERLVKAYVGYGIADDFCRTLAAPLDPGTRALVEDVLCDEGQAGLVISTLASAAADDATLDSRLALWGRRLVGEALSVVQRVLADNPRMRDLLVQALGDDVVGESQQRLFSMLTAEHSRRMERLGLTP